MMMRDQIPLSRLVVSLLFGSLFFTVGLVEAFDVPKGIHRLPDLETARKIAFEEERPVLLIYTHEAIEPT